MVNVSHLAILSDGLVSPTPGGDIDTDIDFPLPDNTANRRGVLEFVLVASSPDLTFSAAQMTDRRAGSTARHTEHEVVSGFVPGDNTLRITVPGGTGTLQVSDVVLFYDRDI